MTGFDGIERKALTRFEKDLKLWKNTTKGVHSNTGGLLKTRNALSYSEHAEQMLCYVIEIENVLAKTDKYSKF